MIDDSPPSEARGSSDPPQREKTKCEVKKPSYLHTAKKQSNQRDTADNRRAAAASVDSSAAPSNGQSGIRDDLKDLFSPTPSLDKEEKQPETRVKKKAVVSVGEGEQDQTPLLLPVQLHTKANVNSSESKIKDSKEAKRPTDVGKNFVRSGKQNNSRETSEDKGSGSKDAFGFISEIIKLESPVDREPKGLKGKVPMATKSNNFEENNKTTAKTKTKMTATNSKKETVSKDSGCHIRELSASPSRAMTRERSESSPSRLLKAQGKAGPSSTQRGARSRSGSRGRGTSKQSSSPTF